MACMDEPQGQLQPSQPPPEPAPPASGQPEAAKRPPLTPAKLRSRYLTEAIIVLLVCLWFIHDGWFNPEIHSKSFNKLGAVLLGWWFLWDMWTVLKYHRAAKAAQAQSPQSPPADSK